MGLLRWAAIIGTGGLAPVKGTSPRERTAKAAEKQVRLQQQLLRGGHPTTNRSAPRRTQATVATFRIPCVHCGQHIRVPVSKNITCLKCGRSMDVVRRGGWGFYRIHSVVPAAPVLDSRGRVIAQPPGQTQTGNAIPEAGPNQTGAAAAADAARAQALANGATAAEAQSEAAYAAVAHAAGHHYSPNAEAQMSESREANIASELGRLADLHGQGALTDEEFAAAKAKTLGSS